MEIGFRCQVPREIMDIEVATFLHRPSEQVQETQTNVKRQNEERQTTTEKGHVTQVTTVTGGSE